MHSAETIKATRVHMGAGLGVVTVSTTKTDSPFLLHPFKTFAVSDLVGDVAEVVHNSGEAAALVTHEAMVRSLMTQPVKTSSRELSREPGLRTAIKAAGGIRALAAIVGIQPSAVMKWRRIPADRIIQIEVMLHIDRKVLRPDLYRHREDQSGSTRRGADGEAQHGESGVMNARLDSDLKFRSVKCFARADENDNGICLEVLLRNKRELRLLFAKGSEALRLVFWDDNDEDCVVDPDYDEFKAFVDAAVQR